MRHHGEEPSLTVPRHGDAQRVSPRHFSPAVAATAFFFTPSPHTVRFADMLLRRFFPAIPTPLSCRFEARQSWSPPLGESWRASFNEKLISRVKSLTASEERALFFFALVLPAVLDFAASLFSLPFRFLPLSSASVSSFVNDARFAPHPFFPPPFPIRLLLTRRLVSPRCFLPMFSRFYHRCFLRTAAPFIIFVGVVT